MKKGIIFDVDGTLWDSCQVVADSWNEYLRKAAPDVPVVNTVGCGDSMMGAMAVAAVGGMAVEDMLRYATAVSAANAMNLETGYFRQEDFQAVLPQVRVKRVG